MGCSPDLGAGELLGDADPVHVCADDDQPEDDVQYPVEDQVVKSLDAAQGEWRVVVHVDDEAADEVGDEQVCDRDNIEEVSSWKWFS